MGEDTNIEQDQPSKDAENDQASTDAAEDQKDPAAEESQQDAASDAPDGEKTALPNNVTIEEAGPCKKKVIIEIPEKTVADAIDEQYEDLRQEAVLPGFRKGRAPRRLLEKRFGKEASEQVKLKLLAKASDDALKDNKLDALGEPDVDFEKIDLPESGSLTFEFEIEVRPEFDLPELEGIPVDRTKLEISDEQITREIEQMQRLAGIWAPRDENGVVEVNDQVVADVLLKIEDVDEVEKIDNTEVYVRANGFVGSIPVEKLDELLAGAKSGETRETTVEVPKTYFKEDYRGKKVEIKIEIKDMKYLKPAELDETFLTRIGAEDEADLRDKVQDSLQSRLEQQSRSEMTDQIYKYLLDNTNFELPMDIVAQQAGSVLQRQYTNLMMRGLAREQLEEQMEQLQASSEQQAQTQLKTFFIMDTVAEKFEIEVTEEEINGHIAQLAIQRNQRPQKMREDMDRDGSINQFRMQVREDKCISKLLESAKITEKEAEKASKAAKKTTKKKTAKKKKKTAESADKDAAPEAKPAKKSAKKSTKKKTDE